MYYAQKTPPQWTFCSLLIFLLMAHTSFGVSVSLCWMEEPSWFHVSRPDCVTKRRMNALSKPTLCWCDRFLPAVAKNNVYHHECIYILAVEDCLLCAVDFKYMGWVTRLTSCAKWSTIWVTECAYYNFSYGTNDTSHDHTLLRPSIACDQNITYTQHAIMILIEWLACRLQRKR